MVRNHRLWTYLITPSSGLWFSLSVLVIVIDISFLRQHFMNSVPGLFYSFDSSTVNYSGTPRYIKNIFSACPASFFLEIGYISAKYVPLEITWDYRLPSNDLTWPFILLLAHMLTCRFVWNTLSALYCLEKGITSKKVSLWLVLDSVALACLIPIYHCLLISSGDTIEWHTFDFNVFACGKSCTVASIYDTSLDGILVTLILETIHLVMAPMLYFGPNKSLSLPVSVASGAPP